MAWFFFQFSVLHWFKAFLCKFERLFLRKSMFFNKHCLGQVSVIAYNMIFPKTSSNSLEKWLGFIAILCFTLV